jgi:hypothetical protein
LTRARVVVIGCGFGGDCSCAPAADRGDHPGLAPQLLPVHPLPSAATGTVELRSIVEPARRRLRDVELIRRRDRRRLGSARAARERGRGRRRV